MFPEGFLWTLLCSCKKSESVSPSVMSDSLQPHGLSQVPLSMEFSRQEYWSGLPFPSPEGLPNPGIEPRSPVLQADSSPSEPPGKPSCKKAGFCLLNLKLQHFGHLMRRTDSLEKTLMLGKIEGRRRRGRQRIKWLDASPTQCTWV